MHVHALHVLMYMYVFAFLGDCDVNYADTCICMYCMCNQHVMLRISGSFTAAVCGRSTFMHSNLILCMLLLAFLRD